MQNVNPYLSPTEVLCRAGLKMYKRDHAQVRHRETCPVCGRKLVNLYRQPDEQYICGKCMNGGGGKQCARVLDLSPRKSSK